MWFDWYCWIVHVVLKCSFRILWNLVIPLTPWVLGTLLSNVEMLTPSLLHLFRCRDLSWGSIGGARRTLGCPWSGLVECVVFIEFVVLGLVLVNSELWTCNETLFWLSCLIVNFYFWAVMIIIKSCCFLVLFGILLVGENSSVMYV